MRRVVGFASWFAVLVVWIVAPARLAAQSERLTRLVDDAVADLGDPASAADAQRRLENVGAPAVRPVCAVLRAKDGAYAADVRCLLLRVLARLGRDALPALPTLDALLRDADVAVAREAVGALSAMAPFLDEEQCRVLLRTIDNGANRGIFADWNAGVLTTQLRLGREPANGQLATMLRQHVVQRAVACRWLAARAGERTDLGAARDALAEQLELACAREPVRWRNPLPQDAVDVALAWLAVSQQPLSARPARLLLDHRHPDERRHAIAWLHEHGASLPFHERADLVGRLWDVDPTVQVAAAEALAHWGAAALVALPALRLTALHPDARVAGACAHAADVVVAAAELDAVDRPWLLAIDAALRGEASATPAQPCSAKGRAQLAAVPYLAQWNDAAALDRVLRLVETAGDCPEAAVQGVLGWMYHGEPRVVDLACAWLARRGAAVASAYGAGATAGEVAFDRFLRDTAQYTIVSGARRSSIEMMAHLLVATDDDRAALLQDANSRVVAHALARGIAAGPRALLPHVARLQELLQAPTSRAMRVMASDWDPRSLPIDLSAHVRTLAAIALVDLEVELQAADGLDDVVRQGIGLSLPELPRHIASLRGTNRLPALLDRIEDQCRLLMSVPPHLRWPSLAGTTR